ncbi:MAG: cation:proton antiporter, partial [Nitrosopumilaceae archaeon]|nr:cation:proton antiporter [Nitrosopumilaceae archaeon]
TAGVINEILALVVLAVILQMSAGESNTVDPVEVTFATGKIVAFLGGIFLVDYILGKIKRHIPTKIIPTFEKLKTRESEFAIMLIVALTMSLIAEQAGLHFIIGTFFAGLIIYRKLIGKKNFEIASEVSSKITFGFFSPIFFAFIGTELYAKDLVDVLPMFFVLLAVAIGGKIGGGFIASKISGFSTIESKTIGYLMNSRGMVELVIAVVGLETGLIDNSMFAIVVAIGFITTLLAPIMSRVSLKQLKKQISEEK